MPLIDSIGTCSSSEVDVVGTCIFGRVPRNRPQEICKGLLDLSLQLLMQALDVLQKDLCTHYICLPVQKLFGA